MVQSIASQLGTGQTCVGGTGILGSIETSICNIDISVHDAAIVFGCDTFEKLIPNNGCGNIAQVEGIGNSLITTSPSIFDLTNGGYQSSIQVVRGNNEFLQILSSPVAQSLSIAIIFLGLGVLAGTFGAGILANYMGRVGIALALFYYFNATMLSFGSIPPVILLFVNAILAVPTVLLFYDSLGGGQH